MLSGPEAVAPLLKMGFPCQQLGRSSTSSLAAGGFSPVFLLGWLTAGLRAPLGLFPLSCEVAKAPLPEPVSPELQRTVQSLLETSQLVLGAMAKFKGKAKKW